MSDDEGSDEVRREMMISVDVLLPSQNNSGDFHDTEGGAKNTLMMIVVLMHCAVW